MVFKLVYGVRQSEGVSPMGDCVSGSGRKDIARPAEFFRKSPEKIVPVFSGFRSGNPCVKIVDDVSQGSQVGVLSLQFSVGVWCAFCVRSQIVKWKAYFPSSPGFSSALMLRWCLVWLYICGRFGNDICVCRSRFYKMCWGL